MTIMQKLTSPKWNRFRGIRLRWKDKIRLNNVIWRCWHMQFIKKENTLVCQFASPLDEGTHNKPEAVVLEGKYWKRKLAAVTAEYKRWRMFYRNKIMGWANKDISVPDMDMFDWQSQGTDSHLGLMMVDEDYMELMSDTLFSTITANQPFAFPDTREIAKGANLADFIQPSLVQLQPNLDDFMDALEPFQAEVFSSKLPPVPEDCAVTELSYRSTQSFPDLTLESQSSTLQPPPEVPAAAQAAYQPVLSYNEPLPTENTSEVKSPPYFQAKVSSRSAFPTNLSGTCAAQSFVCPEAAPQTTPTVVTVGRTFKFDANSSESKCDFPGGEVHQRSFKVSPSGASKVAYKPSQYQQISSSMGFSSTQYNRSEDNYDLAGNSQETLLPEMPVISQVVKGTMKSNSMPVMNKAEAFAVPKQQTAMNLKPRQRTKSGSSAAKSKPPPLSTANSDSALNISSALLAQLLTSNNSRVYNVTNLSERVQPGQNVLKSTNVPIMPSPPKGQRQNVLPITHPNTLLVSGPVSAMQNYVGTVRPTSSPESIGESNKVQNMSSSRRLSRSPTSQLIFTGTLSPTSIQKSDSSTKCGSSSGFTEHRRVCHINAEQKRRYNIKNGFDVLHSLIPYLNLNPKVKLSKATMLQKGAEYIRQLQAERAKMQEDMEALKYQIDSLSASISNCQSLLPATGAPISHHRTTKMKEMFDDFFSLLFEPLLQSFNCSVSTASYEDLYRSTLIWVEQHCSLVELRPAVLNSLRNLCTATEILSNPSKLPEEARAAVSGKKKT
ncbi:hypothetical protein RUM44_008799 [Polyplax serrata]|uniref:BHLH domain-containing protein n=1 Tax=Polyplax serrata TaxID=468196 RepID=A0ABR1BBG4_POLSC